MSFTYLLNEGLPNDRDKVRFYTGDTIEDGRSLEDEEIDMVLTEEPNLYWAAASCVNAIISKLQGAYWEDQKVGETRLRAKRINELKILADQLRARGGNHQEPSIGGVYKDEQEAMLSNTNILQGDFYRGMTDYPGTTKRSRPSLDFYH